MVSFGNSPSFDWNQLCRWTKADPNQIPPFIYKSYTAHSYVDDQKNGFAKYIEKEKKLIGKKVDLEF